MMVMVLVIAALGYVTLISIGLVVYTIKYLFMFLFTPRRQGVKKGGQGGPPWPPPPPPAP